jgi:hypothetical protein
VFFPPSANSTREENFFAGIRFFIKSVYCIKALGQAENETAGRKLVSLGKPVPKLDEPGRQKRNLRVKFEERATSTMGSIFKKGEGLL